MAEADAEYSLVETICGSLLQQLRQIWDEVGESNEDKEKMLLQLKEECLDACKDVCKREIDRAEKSRADLHQALADAKVELSCLRSALGVKTFIDFPKKTVGKIKEQLAAVSCEMNKMMKLKGETIKEFSDVRYQTQKICEEIAGTSEQVERPKVDEFNLSLKSLQKFSRERRELQKSEVSHEVHKLVSKVRDLCAVLGTDLYTTVAEVHPSLNDSPSVQSKSTSSDTVERLTTTDKKLKEDKKQTLHKLQEFETQLTYLWTLMDAPEEERNLFDHVTCNISASVNEVTIPGALALDLTEEAEAEVERLGQLKSSQIASAKQAEPEEIIASAHINVDFEADRKKTMALKDSGNVEPADLLADMDNQVAKAKEAAVSRNKILDMSKRQTSAIDEESWVEEYNRSGSQRAVIYHIPYEWEPPKKNHILMLNIVTSLNLAKSSAACSGIFRDYKGIFKACYTKLLRYPEDCTPIQKAACTALFYGLMMTFKKNFQRFEIETDIKGLKNGLQAGRVV